MHRRAQSKVWEPTMILTTKRAAGTLLKVSQQSLHFSYALLNLHTGSSIQSKQAKMDFLKINGSASVKHNTNCRISNKHVSSWTVVITTISVSGQA